VYGEAIDRWWCVRAAQCDVACGGGGIRRRIVHCQWPSGEILPDADCPLPAPPSSQPCGLDPCPQITLPPTTSTSPATVSARWRKSRWSAVSLHWLLGRNQNDRDTWLIRSRWSDDGHCDSRNFTGVSPLQSIYENLKPLGRL